MKSGKRVYEGLGFPVLITDVKRRMTSRGEVDDINYGRLERTVFAALVTKPGAFTGAEVKFIRHHMELTQNAFADLMGVDRSAITKWEAKEDSPTGMMESTEVVLRIRMCLKVNRSLDRDIGIIMPAVRKKLEAEPLEVSVA